MTILRVISPGLRSALVLSAGLALISVPFMLGLEAAAVATALAGQLGATAVFATAGAATLVVTAITRYSSGQA